MLRTQAVWGVFALATLAVAPGHANAENLNAPLLASACVVCHGDGGNSLGHIPSISDGSAAKIATTMREFRDGKRSNTIMGKIAKGYTDAQIDAIAGHFGKK